MKLIYSPYYGTRPYVDLAGRGGILFDTKAVGTAGLLDELELRLGMKGTYCPETERLVAYVKAMRQALSLDGSLFFAESFSGDEVGTAKVLLGWRDALKMALWDGKAGESERLRGLSHVESYFGMMVRFDSGLSGMPDRWLQLREVLSDCNTVSFPGLEIECRVPAESMPKVIAETLSLLPRVDIPVACVAEASAAAPEGTALRRIQEVLLGAAPVSGGREALPADGTFRYYDLQYGYDAFQMVAGGVVPEEGRVLVVEDPKRLNDTLSVLDRPRVGAEAGGYPQSEQLFLLGLSLFRTPVDVNSLTSYLRVPVNPLGKLHVRNERKDGSVYYRALHRELLDILLEKGGLEGWKDKLDAALYDGDGASLGTKAREEVLGRINMWERLSPSGDIPVEELRAYMENMRKWADGCAAVTEDSGFSALSSYCSAVSSLLEGKEGTLDFRTLTRWATALMQSVPMGSTPAEEGAFDVIGDIRETVDGPRSAIWLGCIGGDAAPYPYDFLSEGEKRFVGVPSKEDVSRYAHEALVASVASVRESLVLVTYAVMDGAPTREHPLMIELKAKFSLAPEEELPEELWADGVFVPAGTSISEYRVDPSVFAGLDVPREEGGLRRFVESATSLQTLILYPFDYVMRYILRMQPYGEAELQDVSTVRGKVAHLYVQRLVELSGKDTGRMAAIHASSFDSLVLGCAECKGAALLLEENGLEYTRFKETLCESVTRLVDMLNRNALTVAGTEVEVRTELPVIGNFVAFIDLLLKDSSGNYVIFDLKWNEGSYYYRKIESGNILQLALYREAVRSALGGEVSTMGYWVIPKCQLVTVEGTFGDTGADVVYYPDSGRDVFSEVCRSYEFRMDQLRKGIVEEGEGYALFSLDYYNHQAALGLYPLEPAFDDEGAKGRPYGNENLTLKGGLV